MSEGSNVNTEMDPNLKKVLGYAKSIGVDITKINYEYLLEPGNPISGFHLGFWEQERPVEDIGFVLSKCQHSLYVANKLEAELGRSPEGRLLAIATTDLEKATWGLEKARDAAAVEPMTDDNDRRP